MKISMVGQYRVIISLILSGVIFFNTSLSTFAFNLNPQTEDIVSEEDTVCESVSSSDIYYDVEDDTEDITVSSNEPVTELIGFRTENTKTFVNADHSFTKVYYPSAVSYETEGVFVDINNSLNAVTSDTETYYQNQTGSFKVKFAETADRDSLFSFSEDDCSLDFVYVPQGDNRNVEADSLSSETEDTEVGANSDFQSKIKILKEDSTYPDLSSKYSNQSNNGKESNHSDEADRNASAYVVSDLTSSAVYEDIEAGVDIKYTVCPEKVKEDIILKNPSVPSSYTFSVTSSGLKPELSEDGSVYFYKNKEAVYKIPSPFVYDAAACVDEGACYELLESDEGYSLTIRLSEKWLESSNRKFPVTVDPTIEKFRKKKTLSALGEFACVSSDGGRTTDADKFYAGNSNGITYRTYMKPILPSLPSGSVVTSAKLRIDAGSGNYNTFLYSLSGVNASGNEWKEDSITWDNQPAGSDVNLAEKVPDDYCRAGGSELDITAIVKDSNYNGFYLRAENEKENNTKRSVTPKQSYTNPFLSITYRDFSGIEDYLSTHDQSIYEDGRASINDYTGKLTYVQEIAKSAGERMPISIKEVYSMDFDESSNSYGNTVRYGNHIRNSADERILIPAGECQVTDYPYVYIDSDGTRHYFKRKQVVIYQNGAKRTVKGTDYYPSAKDEDGLGLFIVPVNDDKLKSEYPIKLTDRSGSICKYFDKSGYLCLIRDDNKSENGKTPADKEENAITVSREAVDKASVSEKEKKELDLIIDEIKGSTFTDENCMEEADKFIGKLSEFIINSYGINLDYYAANHMGKALTNLEILRDAIGGYGEKKNNVLTQLNKVSTRYEKLDYIKADEKITSVTDPAGQTSIFKYDANGCLVSVTNPYESSRTTELSYNNGNLVKITKNLANGKTETTELSYDSKGRLTEVINPVGNGIRYEYGEAESESAYNTSVSKVTELYSFNESRKSLLEGQSFLISYKNLNETVYTYAGNDGVLGNQEYKWDKKKKCYIPKKSNKTIDDDYENVYIFDNEGRTKNVYSRERKTGLVIGGKVYEYTTENDGEGAKNKITEMAVTGSQTVNYLSNGSFENEGVWDNTDKENISKTEHYMGEKSLCITGTSKAKTVTQTIKVSDKGIYTASVYIHTDGVLSKGTKAGIRLKAGSKTSESEGGIETPENPTPEKTPDEGVDPEVEGGSEESGEPEPSGEDEDPEEDVDIPGESGDADLDEDTDDSINNGWERVSCSINAGKNSQITVELYLEGTQGSAWFDCVTLEKGNTPNQFNILENASFEADNTNPTGWDYNDDNGRGGSGIVSNPDKNSNSAKLLDLDSKACQGNNAFLIKGETNKRKILSVKPAFDKSKSSYAFACYVKADCTPVYGGRKCEIRVVKDNDILVKQEINVSVKNWQYVNVPLPRKNWSGAKIEFVLKDECGSIIIDNCMLTKNEVQTYNYTSTGKLKRKSIKEKTDTSGTNARDLKCYDKTAGGQKTTYSYNHVNNDLVGIKRSLGAYEDYKYDAYGNLIETEAHRGDLSIVTTTGYTEDGRFVAKKSDERGYRTLYSYNGADGVLKAFTDAKNVKTEYTYDEFHENTGISSADMIVSFAYNDKRLPEKIINGNDSEAQKYEISYDQYDNIDVIKSGKTTFIDYDYYPGNGQVKTEIHGKARKEYSYNIAGLVTAENWKKDGIISYNYDNRGALVKVSDSKTGIGTEYGYDNADRITSLVMRDRLGKTRERLQNTYDKAGRVKEFTYGHTEKLYTTDYRYRKDDKISSIILPDGSEIDVDYDVLGRETVREFKPQKITREKREIQKTVNSVNVETTITYLDNTSAENNGVKIGNTTSLPETYTVKVGESVAVNDNLSYDENGRISTHTSSDRDMVYSYDRNGRLIKGEDKISKNVWEYAYDSAGNILSSKLNGSDEGTYSYKAGVLSAYKNDIVKKDKIKYDKAGNPVKYKGMSMTWTRGRNLSGISAKSKKLSFTYDSKGNRLSKTSAIKGSEKTVTEYIINENTILAEIRKDEKGNIKDILNYSYDNEGRVVEIEYVKDGKSTYYTVEHNILGDVTVIYTLDGKLAGSYSYDPYGKILEIKGNDANDIVNLNPFRYRSYYYDKETELYYLSSRYYDPEVKRFINADDPTYLGVGEELNSYNLYAYCGGDPVNGADPTGHVTLSFSYGGSGSIFFSGTYGYTLSFDSQGNYNFQNTKGLPFVTDTVGIGLLYVGFGPQITITNKKDVSDLNGYSSILGGGAGLGGKFGLDLIHIGRMNNDGEDINGISIAPMIGGMGIGIDIHALETYSEEITSGKLSDLPQKIKEIFGNIIH